MLTIYKDRLIHIEWTIYKGTSSVREDFTRALVKCFLIGPREKYLVNATAQSGTLYIELPQGLEEGSYSIEAIYVKNQGNLTPRCEPLSPCNAPDYRRTPYPPFKPHDSRYNDRCIMRSRRDCLFAITEYEQEEECVPTASSGEVTLRFSTSTSSYGYDGLSAYEIAVMRGDFNGSEKEFIEASLKLKIATSERLGGIKAEEKTDNETEEAKIDPVTGKLYVPAGKANVEIATSEKVGGIKAEQKTSDYEEEAKIDPSTGKLYIRIPVASSTKAGGVVAEQKTSRDTVEAKIDPITNKLFVEPIGEGSVTYNYTNYPDDEDLTEETRENEEKVVKLADKEYNAAGFSGLGRVYSRKNISSSKNVLTQDMVSKANTRYIIQYDYDLNGATINVPEGCVLDFQGGSISNGILNGNLTKISSYPIGIFNNITIAGNWIINQAHAEWFGAKGDGSTDDTEAIQKCLNSFFKCTLLSKTYVVTSIKLPDNSMLEGLDLGREKMSTIKQIESYSGDLITTGNTSYSGVVLKYFRITGGKQDNFAITITVPQSYVYKVTTDLYHGSGIHLSERAWITVIDSCSLFGNIDDASTRSTISYAIKIDSAGGLVKVLNCNINYYIVGVAIVRGDQVTICNTNISECSQNQFPKLPLYAIWIINGKSIDVFDNYIENFNTGIRIESGTSINIHDNFINGLKAAPFGIDITGEINGLNIKENYIYTGYTGAKCIRALSVTGENTVRIVRNNLDETKLSGCEKFYFETYSNITDFRKIIGYPITIKKISDIHENISENTYNIPSNISRIMYSIEDRSSYSDIGTTLTYRLPVSTSAREGSVIIFDKGKEDKYFQTTIDAGNEIITGLDQPGNRSQIQSITGMTGTIALIAKYGYWQVLWCTGTWIYKNGFISAAGEYIPTENLKAGNLFFDETSKKLKVYNGLTWATLASEEQI